MAVDTANNVLFVADNSTNGQLLVYDSGSTPSFVAGIALPSPSSSPNPVALAVDSSGDVFVADANNAEIYEYSPPFSSSSTPVRSFSSGGTSPSALAYDPGNNYLYVANAGSNTVYQLDAATGNQLRSIGSYQSVFSPAALAVDPSHRLYVANKAGGTYFFDSTLSSSSLLFASNNPAYPDALAPATTSGTFGLMYVAESATNVVSHYSYGGTSNSSPHFDSSQGVSSPIALAYFNGNLLSASFLHGAILHKPAIPQRRLRALGAPLRP